MATDEGAVSTTQTNDRGLDVMVVVAIQVVVAVSVWGLVGLLIDLALGTGPWVQFGGIMLGTFIALALAQRHATPADDPESSHG
jgi:F0F1-type ATP synthase assembly protein I